MSAPAGGSQRLQLAGSWRSSLKFLTGLFGYVTSIGFLNLTRVINDFPPPVRLAFLFASLITSKCSFSAFSYSDVPLVPHIGALQWSPSSVASFMRPLFSVPTFFCFGPIKPRKPSPWPSRSTPEGPSRLLDSLSRQCRAC